ncbi:ribbon-helix-helix protein, CopG family [Thiotrichales bacterium HSG1]|nr:ribbon-helix-helix protein, CopG family [Thiotrichales bacterium HSG1]
MIQETRFMFEQTVIDHLDKLANIEKKSINALIRDMIEERYEKLKQQQKLDNFYSGIGLSTGLIGNNSIQEIKANRNV